MLGKVSWAYRAIGVPQLVWSRRRTSAGLADMLALAFHLQMWLAGTLRDLVLGQEMPLTALPWVNRAVRQWEPEPFRWLAVRSVYAVLKSADRAEARGQGHGTKLARFGSWIKSF